MKNVYLNYRSGFSRLSKVQGAVEQHTELYLAYSEGAAQPATQQSAKSTGGVAGSAGKQAGEAGKARC